jgi:hypothetical protein
MKPSAAEHFPSNWPISSQAHGVDSREMQDHNVCREASASGSCAFFKGI